MLSKCTVLFPETRVFKFKRSNGFITLLDGFKQTVDFIFVEFTERIGWLVRCDFLNFFVREVDGHVTFSNFLLNSLVLSLKKLVGSFAFLIEAFDLHLVFSVEILDECLTLLDECSKLLVDWFSLVLLFD